MTTEGKKKKRVIKKVNTKKKKKDKSLSFREQVDFVVKDIKSVGSLATAPSVVYVPTIFPGFNRATRIKGSPTRCIMIVQGPTSEGKSVFCAGLLKSFIEKKHIPLYVDAEHATDPLWWMNLGLPNWLPFVRPESYEHAVSVVDDTFQNFVKGQKSGKIHPERYLVVVIDTINKLMPTEVLQKFKKEGIKKGFPINALYNNVWLDALTPLIGLHNVLFVIVAQERVDKKMIDKSFAAEWQKYKPKGGDSLGYDSALIVRISQSATLKEEIGGVKKEIGKAHKGFVIKNKVGFCHEEFRFHTVSRGIGEAEVGFDLVRDLMFEAQLRGIVKKKGNNYILNFGNCEAEGLKNIRLALRNDEKLQKSLLEHLDETSTVEDEE